MDTQYYQDFDDAIQKLCLNLFGDLYQSRGAESGTEVRKQKLHNDAVILTFRAVIRATAELEGILPRAPEQSTSSLINLNADESGRGDHLFSDHRLGGLAENWSSDGNALASLRYIRETVFKHEPDLSAIGSAFESIYGKRFKEAEDGSFKAETTVSRRDQGVYYTPPELARKVVRMTLKLELQRRTGATPLLDLQVVDPACGCGIFLLEALRYLSQSLVRRDPSLDFPQAKRLVAKNCLYAVDLNRLAVDIAKALIWVEVGQRDLPLCFLDGKVKTGDALLGANTLDVSELRELKSEGSDKWRQVASKKISCRLDGSSHKNIEEWIDPFVWRLEFPEVFDINDRDSGFDVALGNPPWGKVEPDYKEYCSHFDTKVSLYQGEDLHKYVQSDESSVGAEKLSEWKEYVASRSTYKEVLKKDKSLDNQKIRVNGKKTGGSYDLYKLFMDRVIRITSRKGRVGFIVPASVYQSQGAAGIRQSYLKNGSFKRFVSFQNNDKIFPIHRSFKFVVFSYKKGRKEGIYNPKFRVQKLSELEKGNSQSGNHFSVSFLEKTSRGLLTVPELGSETERDILNKIYKCHPPLGDKMSNGWQVSFNRELDMTNDRDLFERYPNLQDEGYSHRDDGTLRFDGRAVHVPVFEGRMVNQFDYAAKAYVSGQGRRAEWQALPPNDKKLVAHHYVTREDAREYVRGVSRLRAGFCDVTGYANERTVLASMIPSGFPCGNKVPTCEFSQENPLLPLVWTAIANSFVVDWVVRRKMSTTLNFFIFEQVPFPRIDPESEIGIRLCEITAMLNAIGAENHNSQLGEILNRNIDLPDSLTLRERADLRAEADVIVASVFDLTLPEFAQVLSDFNSIDRSQPTHDKMVGNSTITRDLVLSRYEKYKGEDIKEKRVPYLEDIRIGNLNTRVRLARKSGANAYVPSEQVRK